MHSTDLHNSLCCKFGVVSSDLDLRGKKSRILLLSACWAELYFAMMQVGELRIENQHLETSKAVEGVTSPKAKLLLLLLGHSCR